MSDNNPSWRDSVGEKRKMDLSLRLPEADLAYFKEFIKREYTNGDKLVELIPDDIWDCMSCCAMNQRLGGDDYYLAYVRGFEKVMEAMIRREKSQQ